MNKKSKQPIENKIYASIIGLCEELESKKTYKGNGHHLAQKLTVKISEGLLPKQQKAIYDVMTKTPMTSNDIGKKCNLSSKTISSQLKQIYETTLLIGFKSNGRFKLWFKYD